jgi:hypothetical protein
MLIRNSEVVSAISVAFRNLDVDVCLDVAPKVSTAIDIFNKNVDSRMKAWVSQVEPRPLFTVLTEVDFLKASERDSFESVLLSYAGWVVLAGDLNRLLLGPSKDYTEDQIRTYLTNYLVYSGRFCHRCRVFTEFKSNKSIWVCPCCGAKVSCHKDTDVAFGSVADQATAEIRKKTHRSIDVLWREGIMSRKEVYFSISRLLNVHGCYTHIAMLSAEQCEIVNKWANAAVKYGVGDGSKKDR